MKEDFQAINSDDHTQEKMVWNWKWPSLPCLKDTRSLQGGSENVWVSKKSHDHLDIGQSLMPEYAAGSSRRRPVEITHSGVDPGCGSNRKD